MTSSEELQRLIKATLEADANVMELAFRVYDHVSSTSPYGSKNSYIAFGPMDTVEDDAGCISGVETTIQLDIWTRKAAAIECRRLTDLVRRALHGKDLTLTENALVSIRVPLTRVFPDPSQDHHGVVQVTCLVEE